MYENMCYIFYVITYNNIGICILVTSIVFTKFIKISAVNIISSFIRDNTSKICLFGKTCEQFNKIGKINIAIPNSIL